jgi:predicted metal-dependent phosphoesterase TrpH
VTSPVWRVDCHIHTYFSADSLNQPAALVARARALGLDRIAITDHNQIAGALEARALAPNLVIVGEEIDTAEGGELIAYYVTERVPPHLPILEALDRLQAQGAVISVSHPVDRFRGSAMGVSRLLQIIDRVDALEVFNARCLVAADNRRAALLANEHGKGITAGSDCHVIAELGRAYLQLPAFEDDPASFRSSLRQAQAAGRLSGIWPHLGSTLAKYRKRI